MCHQRQCLYTYMYMTLAITVEFIVSEYFVKLYELFW